MLRRVLLAGLCLCLSASSLRDARGAVLLTENAEGGAGNVTTNVSAYALIQSDVVGQGSNAFHLANPGLQDNWFALTPAVTIQADSKLFFQSRLGYVAPGQVAKVQLSLNNGSTWPTTLYSQTGTSDGSGPVEGAFSLRTVNLSPYAGQSARFRFYYDYMPGFNGFDQTNTIPPVGWFVDDIQIADQLAKTQYSIGNPTGEEQLYLEYINRARKDALVEANRLANESDPSITSAYSFFNITGSNINNQFQWYVTRGASAPEEGPQFAQVAQPLAFNEKLLTAARLHSQDMLTHEFQGHDSSADPPSPLIPFGDLSDRLSAVGYSAENAGENVYSYAESPREGHAAFDVDWGHVNNFNHFYNPAFDSQGMQNAAGHRLSIHNPLFKEVGIGVVNGTNGSVGPQLVTQDFGNPGDTSFVTGVVYQDLNANNFYDIGEGRSGVRVDVDGSAYYALSSASGGYSVPVSDDGFYNVLFSGGGFANFSTVALIAGGLNVKLDYKAVPGVTYAADFNSDGRVDADDLLTWRGDFRNNNGSDADNDGDSDGADFLVWQRQLGSGVTTAAVPEPSAALLFCGMGLTLAARQRWARSRRVARAAMLRRAAFGAASALQGVRSADLPCFSRSSSDLRRLAGRQMVTYTCLTRTTRLPQSAPPTALGDKGCHAFQRHEQTSGPTSGLCERGRLGRSDGRLAISRCGRRGSRAFRYLWRPPLSLRLRRRAHRGAGHRRAR